MAMHSRLGVDGARRLFVCLSGGLGAKYHLMRKDLPQMANQRDLPFKTLFQNQVQR
jgi:hypothetical protein